MLQQNRREFSCWKKLHFAKLLAGIFMRRTPMSNPAAHRVDEDVRAVSVGFYAVEGKKKKKKKRNKQKLHLAENVGGLFTEEDTGGIFSA